MKYASFFCLPVVLLLSCQEDTKEDTSSENSFAITNVDVSSVPCDGEEPPTDEVTLSVSGGTLNVLHNNYADSSCLGFEVSGEQEGNNITISYTETGEPCDCTSMYTLAYDIEGLSTGSYSLSIPGSSTEEVTIE